MTSWHDRLQAALRSPQGLNDVAEGIARGDLIIANTKMEQRRYKVTSYSGEYATAFYVVDTEQPEAEQPAIVFSVATRTELGYCANARQLAEQYADKANKESA